MSGAEEETARLLAELHARLGETQRLAALGTLAGGLAHDFNNVLFAIQGNTDMALMELPEDHPAHASLVEAQRSCARAKALVQRILALSRRQETPPRPLGLGAIVAETARLLRSALPPGVTIASDIAPDLPLVVADEVEVQQLVLELCTNAGHALEETGGEIRLVVEAVDGHVRLAVTDRGTGVEASILPRIFDPFFTTKPMDEGTGLGLAVVRRIVDGMRGSVTVRSAPGEGSTFEVLLPANNAAAEAAGALSRGDGAGRSVLFVDDEPSLVRLAERLLARVGFRVIAVGSAAAALEALRASDGKVDVVLTDLAMPRVDGLELAAAIRKEWPLVPVLLTTGNDITVDAERVRGLGIREIVRKPWGAQQLIDALFRHLPADGRG